MIEQREIRHAHREKLIFHSTEAFILVNKQASALLFAVQLPFWHLKSVLLNVVAAVAQSFLTSKEKADR
jgi:hypothetical protein